MRILRLGLAGALGLGLSAPAQAGELEALKAVGEARFSRAGAWRAAAVDAPVPDVEGFAVDPSQGAVRAAERKTTPLILYPTVTPIDPQGPLGPMVGSFVLAERLDAHRDLAVLQLGSQTWAVSVAGDPAFKTLYLSFAQQDRLILKKVEDPNRIRSSEGIVISIDDQTQYRFKISVNIFSPVRGSTLKIDPVNGTNGPSHKFSTGEVLDRVKAESYVFEAAGVEYSVLYGTDVDPQTEKPADTRSLLIFRENGLSSKAWPVAESKLPADTPTEVDFDGTKVVLVRGSDGKLRIHEPASSSPSAR